MPEKAIENRHLRAMSVKHGLRFGLPKDWSKPHLTSRCARTSSKLAAADRNVCARQKQLQSLDSIDSMLRNDEFEPESQREW